MSHLARCALVVLVCAAAATAGLRPFAPADAPILRAMAQSEQVSGVFQGSNWLRAIEGADPLAPDGLLTDDEIVALLLSTREVAWATPSDELDLADLGDEVPADEEDLLWVPRHREEERSAIAAEGLLGDGTEEDRSPFITLGEPRFDDLALVTQTDDLDPTRRQAGAEGSSASEWGGHLAAMGPRAAEGGSGRSPGFRVVYSGYYLDWPWSEQPGRNMFYWLVGPPALVFLVVGALGAVSEMGSRSS